MCRKLPAYHDDEEGHCYIIRHWEAGVKPRFKSLAGRFAKLRTVVDLQAEYNTKAILNKNHGMCAQGMEAIRIIIAAKLSAHRPLNSTV